MVNMTNMEYQEYVKQRSPRSPLAADIFRAFISGGIICMIGQIVVNLWSVYGLDRESAASAASATMVFIGAALTAVGIYDKIAKFGGAGTLVPITGFANSVASPAMEFKSEGLVTGTAVKMFSIAGPVIVFGTVAGVLYGLVLVVLGSA